MKKETIYIDLSKCSEKQRKHIFSLLPPKEQNNQYDIDSYSYYLSFDKHDGWWVFNDFDEDKKTELTYPEFIKLFEGGETIKSDNTQTLQNALKQIEKLEADKAELLDYLQDEINEFSVLGYEPSQYQLGYNSAINDIMEILKSTPKI